MYDYHLLCIPLFMVARSMVVPTSASDRMVIRPSQCPSRNTDVEPESLSENLNAEKTG